MNTKQFYHSKKWLDFRKVIINEHTGEDGFCRCDICGEPIVNPYDLIVHHKIELSDQNADDALVALNPDNVQVVHFRCHNRIHQRFGYQSESPAHFKKKVYIVYGAPCSGKTTWVHDVATEDDLIVDLDSIWQMISINERYKKPDSLKTIVFDVRDKLYDDIKFRSGKWHNAYVITGGALIGDRERLSQRLGADDLIYIDTAKEVCLTRAQKRGDAFSDWKKYIEDWFELFQPADDY